MEHRNRLQGKNILITGASGGLGLAMATALGAEGATVLLTARRADVLQQAVSKLKKKQFDVYGMEMDARSEPSIANVMDWIGRQWYSLDMLVNNAGIGMRTVNPDFLTDPKPFYEIPSAGFRDVIETNLTGYFLVAKACMPFFLQKKRGKITNISMNHETMKRKGFIPYGPSRAGAESLSLIMAADLRPYHVDVNMLLPGGATDTGMIPEHFKASESGGFRLLSPEVMAEPIVFLAGAESNGITGQRINASLFKEWKQSYPVS